MIRACQLYVTAQTLRDAKTAAQLAGMESPDEWAEATLRQAIANIPQLASLRQRIERAIAKEKREWEAENQRQPDPSIPGAGVALHASATGTI